MSEVRFKCPHCEQIFEGAREDVGAEAECPSCGKVFTLEVLELPLAKRPNGLMCYFGIFKHYVKFGGRVRRREFWYAFLFNFIALTIALVIDLLEFDEYDDWNFIVVGVYFLITFIPMLALQFRRLHDTNKSGWWWLLIPLPVVDLAYLVWLIDDGDKGSNRFGPDPKGRE